jgi:hypothetical protein
MGQNGLTKAQVLRKDVLPPFFWNVRSHVFWFPCGNSGTCFPNEASVCVFGVFRLLFLHRQPASFFLRSRLQKRLMLPRGGTTPDSQDTTILHFDCAIGYTSREALVNPSFLGKA